MRNQMRTTFINVVSSKFYFLAFAVMGVFSAMNIIKQILIDGTTSTGSEVFVQTLEDSSLLFALSVFVGCIIGSEFTNRTIDNEVRTGYSRFSVLISRAIVILPLSVVPYYLHVAMSTVSVVIVNGFGSSMSAVDMLIRFAVFSLQVMSIQGVTLLIMFACKKPFSGIIICFAVTLITCNILRGFWPDDGGIFKYTNYYRISMTEQLDINTLSVQDNWISFAVAIIALASTVCVTYIVFRRSELK